MVLRHAMRGMIPERIRVRRDKADFSIIFVEVLKRAQAEELLESMALEEAGWINAAAYRKLYRAALANYEEFNLWPVWTTCALELWYSLVVLGRKLPLADAASELARAPQPSLA
jgi:hypothetical protein